MATDVPLSPSLAAELAALRRRAYAPGGDIAADTRAAARLATLEGMAREAGTVHVLAPDGRTAQEAPLSAAGEDAAPTARSRTTPTAPRVRAAASEAPGPGPARLSPAARGGVLGAIGLVAAVLVSLWAGGATGVLPAQSGLSGPDAVLTMSPRLLADVDRNDQARSLMDIWDMDPKTLTVSETFQGMRAWAVRTTDGRNCMFVVADRVPEGGDYLPILAAGCAPRGQDAVADFSPMAMLADADADAERTPTRWVRMSVHGETVGVWLTGDFPDARS
nr:hypothetical protein [Microbacterium bovistercoris]